MLYRELIKLNNTQRKGLYTSVGMDTQLMSAFLSASPEPLSISAQCWGSVSAELRDSGVKNPKAPSPRIMA